MFFLTTILVGGLTLGAYTLFVIKTAQPIDPTKISDMLDDSSFIYDSQGNLLEKIAGVENRTIVPMEQIPQDLKNAVISIEDDNGTEETKRPVKKRPKKKDKPGKPQEELSQQDSPAQQQASIENEPNLNIKDMSQMDE